MRDDAVGNDIVAVFYLLQMATIGQQFYLPGMQSHGRRNVKRVYEQGYRKVQP